MCYTGFAVIDIYDYLTMEIVMPDNVRKFDLGEVDCSMIRSALVLKRKSLERALKEEGDPEIRSVRARQIAAVAGLEAKFR